MAGERMEASPSFNTFSRPLQTTYASQDAYFLHLAAFDTTYAASTSSPLNSIQIFDKQTLKSVHSFSGHPSGITFLRTVAGFGGQRESLMSSGKDGCLRAWDPRADGGVGLNLNNPGSRALLSFDVSPDGSTVAAGTDLQGDEAHIVYWDPRQPAAPLVTHTSTHSDDITSLHFSQTTTGPAVLLSGSSDGLVSISNASEPDEDEAVVHVGNMGSSVAQTGWILNDPRAGVWSSSDMENFSTWSHELDHFRTVDMRSPSVHTQGYTWVSDYVVGCHSSSSIPLGIFVGSNEGDVALVSTSLADSSSSWKLERTWTNGHAGVVRSCLWDEQNGVLLTGGEDSKLNLWSCPVARSDVVGDGMDVDR